MPDNEMTSESSFPDVMPLDILATSGYIWLGLNSSDSRAVDIMAGEF
jgi:hypothetical protein